MQTNMLFGQASGTSGRLDLSQAPPSCSAQSARPGSTKSSSIKWNSDLACWMLYSVVESFAFFSHSFTASWRCHQHNCSFASHTSLNIPIISLSGCANLGMTPYLSQRHLPHAFSALIHFPTGRSVAVDDRQYKRGKPALSYSPITLYSSRFLELVLSVGFISTYPDIISFKKAYK